MFDNIETDCESYLYMVFLHTIVKSFVNFQENVVIYQIKGDIVVTIIGQ